MRSLQPWPTLIRLLLLTAALAHIVYNVRYSYAAYLASQDNVPALRRAAQITPADAALYTRLAALDPGHRLQWIAAALERNPTNALLWIERGVNAEVSGNSAAAEADLLEAARLDRQYIPRWTLAAFYFRQRNVPQFRAWARLALDMAWGDALPLFQMASQLGMSSDEIRKTMLPDRAPVLSAFVSECIRRKDLEETFRTTHRLIETGAKAADLRVALSAMDTLFDAGRTSPAVELWNQASASHWFPHPSIGAPIPNAEFSFDFLPGGFDWRTSAPDGVVFWRLGHGRGLQFEFSGRQPESCTLLKLNLPVESGKSVSVNVKASGFNAGSGLQWRLGTQAWDVVTPRESVAVQAPAPQLILTYNRALGTKRIEGTLTLYRVDVTP